MKDKIKILIGDNSAKAQKYASQLRDLGYFVITRIKNDSVIYSTIRNEQPDVAIVYASTPGVAAAELIRKSNKLEMTPIFIVIGLNDDKSIETQVIIEGAYCFIPEPIDVTVLNNHIKTALYFLEPINWEIIVTDAIHRIGVPSHIKGYHYLREAILCSINDEEILENISKRLYPAVAKEFHTTPSRVEKNIRHAIEIAWDRGDMDVLDSYFDYSKNKSRPVNGVFISRIIDKIKLSQIKNSMLKEATLRNSSVNNYNYNSEPYYDTQSNYGTVKIRSLPVDWEIIVTNAIHRIGIPSHIKGYHYLREAILCSINDRKMLENISDRLYPAVAKKFATTPSRVERDIRHAIDIAWDGGYIDSYFDHTTNGVNPANDVFISMITNKIKLSQIRVLNA